MREITKQVWENYGDVNPIEHGGIWIKRDTEVSGECFYIVKNIPMDDRYGWFLQFGYVDLSDSWIEWPSVFDYTDSDWATDPEIRAINAFDYYGPVEFGGASEIVGNEAELVEKLSFEGIEVE